MASDFFANRSLRQRKLMAIAFVTVLALVAVIWGVKVYILPDGHFQ